MSGKVGVAISTTGTRTEMLNDAWHFWRKNGREIGIISVETDIEREGVAVTKNRGIAALMDAGCEHLFLADDDMYPLSAESWRRYVDQPIGHLSLCWGGHRRLESHVQGYSNWKWPRGVMLYLHRSMVEKYGGMREEYGPGGHEHVDLSRRIHQGGDTPYPYMDLEQDPRQWFHAEDMPRAGETVPQFAARKRRHTTIKRTSVDKRRVDRLWRELDGDTSYVEYR